jgi:hypothetical protein
MTIDDGGWLLIANVPPAPDGYWEHNASSRSVTTPIADLTTFGMLLPADVDSLGLAYSEVLFTDTTTNNWFTVDRTSTFYLHYYRGSCGDPAVSNQAFAVTGRSSGSGDLIANWVSFCPNAIDTVTTDGFGCGATIFVIFDTSCGHATGATRLRVYVR